jgi:hypothetical protein
MTMRVFVYWNLHRGLWSVKALDGPDKGRVIARRYDVLLSDAEGKVYEAGRQRVLREKRKNVHAGIVGQFELLGKTSRLAHPIIEIGDRITYNPYKYERFVHTVDESPFEGSAYALLTADRAVYVA